MSMKLRTIEAVSRWTMTNKKDIHVNYSFYYSNFIELHYYPRCMIQIAKNYYWIESTAQNLFFGKAIIMKIISLEIDFFGWGFRYYIFLVRFRELQTKGGEKRCAIKFESLSSKDHTDSWLHHPLPLYFRWIYFLGTIYILVELMNTFSLFYLHKKDVKSILVEFYLYFSINYSEIVSITKSVAWQLNNNICNWNRSFHHSQANTTFF